MNICVYETIKGLSAVRFEGDRKPDLPIGARIIAIIFDQPGPIRAVSEPVRSRLDPPRKSRFFGKR